MEDTAVSRVKHTRLGPGALQQIIANVTLGILRNMQTYARYVYLENTRMLQIILRVQHVLRVPTHCLEATI